MHVCKNPVPRSYLPSSPLSNLTSYILHLTSHIVKDKLARWVQHLGHFVRTEASVPELAECLGPNRIISDAVGNDVFRIAALNTARLKKDRLNTGLTCFCFSKKNRPFLIGSRISDGTSFERTQIYLPITFTRQHFN